MLPATSVYAEVAWVTEFRHRRGQLPAGGNEQGAGSALHYDDSYLACSCRLHVRRERCCGRPFRYLGKSRRESGWTSGSEVGRPSTSPESGQAMPAHKTAVIRGPTRMLASTHVMSVAPVIRRDGGRAPCQRLRRGVASGGEVAAALYETSARRCCHNVAGAEPVGVRGICEQGGCT
jgi:hypothetical protein